uniref:Uncharacterized protein n=1 Tax=Solanum tuberosum TaxID=4113 RepID=M1DAZ5_SOLTU
MRERAKGPRLPKSPKALPIMPRKPSRLVVVTTPHGETRGGSDKPLPQGPREGLRQVACNTARGTPREDALGLWVKVT